MARTFKVGDKVRITRGSVDSRVTVVIRITPSGIIHTSSGHKFTRYGYETPRSVAPYQIEPIND